MIYNKIILEKDQKIFFTSDTHYGHKNICRGTSTWDLSRDNVEGGINSTRDFDTLEEMNNALVKGINDYVGYNDYLIHLGDWSFGGENNIITFREQIVCQNIMFILGNHDHHIANDKYIDYHAESAQDCFTSVDAYSELTVSSSENGKNTYVLFHFPISVWNKAHHNRIHLHGHCHDSFKGEGKLLDVGVDTAFRLFGEYRPFTQKEVHDIMKKKEFVVKDRHNKNTN